MLIVIFIIKVTNYVHKKSEINLNFNSTFSAINININKNAQKKSFKSIINDFKFAISKVYILDHAEKVFI